MPTLHLAASPKTTTPAEAVIAIMRSEVAAAARSGTLATRIRSGTARMPPPTPKNAEKTPAASPMATRRTDVSYEHGQSSRPPRCSSSSPRRSWPRSATAGRPSADRDRDVRRPARIQRLCPSPRCGGYWVAIANGRADTLLRRARRTRCYVARAVDRTETPWIGASRRARSSAARSTPGARTSASSGSSSSRRCTRPAGTRL